MSLNIGSSLTGGVRRVASRNGVLLALAYVVVGLVWQVTFYSAIGAWATQANVPMEGMALPSVAAPIAVLAGVALVSLLALQYLTIVAIRTFVGGHARSIPSEYYRRNVAVVLINSVLGGIVYGFLVFIGSLLFLVPGVIAYVAFTFVLIYVAVEDENFVAALRDSWTLTRGNWLRLFVLLVIAFVAISVVGGVLSVVARLYVAAVAGQAVGIVVSGLITLPFSLFTLGILAEAFTQLRDGQADSLRSAGAAAV